MTEKFKVEFFKEVFDFLHHIYKKLGRKSFSILTKRKL
ncbi:hypothetical protein DDD_3191 [Nonlabens dokdonensis DSW-6]|uniref:Uncharacterized protein n=1 Tax=Nonlabens dokdonensis (strain DSM 17205 / KCTC 12402 / DSW-6) TaxID=592029 RepID=L7WH82_NONDD|nr:hypothetical protein DDD_3191 [Nonlabens dokdonensis DSW-6]